MIHMGFLTFALRYLGDLFDMNNVYNSNIDLRFDYTDMNVAVKYSLLYQHIVDRNHNLCL